MCEEYLFNHEAVDEDKIPLVPGVRGLTSPYVPDLSEVVLADVAHADPSWRITAHRYFKPVRYEPSGTRGEDPRQEPTNLFSVITQVFKGERAYRVRLRDALRCATTSTSSTSQVFTSQLLQQLDRGRRSGYSARRIWVLEKALL